MSAVGVHVARHATQFNTLFFGLKATNQPAKNIYQVNDWKSI